MGRERNNGESQYSRREMRALICILHLHLRDAAVIPLESPCLDEW